MDAGTAWKGNRGCRHPYSEWICKKSIILFAKNLLRFSCRVTSVIYVYVLCLCINSIYIVPLYINRNILYCISYVYRNSLVQCLYKVLSSRSMYITKQRDIPVYYHTHTTLFTPLDSDTSHNKLSHFIVSCSHCTNSYNFPHYVELQGFSVFYIFTN